MINLCSLWDSNYHRKGMAFVASLRRHVPEFTLHVLALDSKVLDALTGAGRRIAGVIPIRLSDIETPDLLAAKANRDAREYIWTLASAFTWWCADTLKLSSLAYIDADCYLFHDLAPLYDEVAGSDVAIIPHRWRAEQTNERRNGIYNVGWVYFSHGGIPCLKHWRDQCLDWCKFEYLPDGRIADQGYLNDWPDRWGAHVVRHLGADLGPWNQAQYAYSLNPPIHPMEYLENMQRNQAQYACSLNGRDLMISDGLRCDPLLFYHFHEFEYGKRRTGYRLDSMIARYVYEPYEAEMRAMEDTTHAPAFN